MFIPIGGVFMFGNGSSPAANIAMALFNILMGALALLFGYLYGLMFLVAIGYLIGGLGLLTLLLNLGKRGRAEPVALQDMQTEN